MSAARERILAKVRAAVAGRPGTAHPGPLPGAGAPSGAASPEGAAASGDPLSGEPVIGVPAAAVHTRVTRFVEQFHANGGEAVRLGSPAQSREWLDSFSREFAGAAYERVPSDLVPDVPLLPPEIAPLGISTAIAAAAESGTLLLDSREGRRQQLLPQAHLVWVRERDIADTLGEALTRVRAAAGLTGLPAVIGLHSAPSKSADIGRILVVGVHGPGRVIAAILAYD